MYVCMYVCISAHTHMHPLLILIHTHTPMGIETYIHTYIHTFHPLVISFVLLQVLC